MAILFNCDMGEGIGNEELLMPYIEAANIACGFHAGDEISMWNTAMLAKKHDVLIGAHPSFPDKKNFGRTEMQMDPAEIYEIVTQQLILLNDVTGSIEASLHHVKPHGALYNMSARDPKIAESIANAVKDFNSTLVLFGLSGSHSIDVAHRIGLRTANEVFADRTYQDNGRLTPRTEVMSMIIDIDKMAMQVMQMAKEGKVITSSGNVIPVKAETICIHGDGEHAVEFAKKIKGILKENC